MIGWIIALGVPLVAVLIANWLVGWPFGRPLRAVRIDRIPPNGEIEMELSNGRVYRSNGGRWWVKFPHGTKPSVGFDLWLADEFDRLEQLDRWSKGE